MRRERIEARGMGQHTAAVRRRRAVRLSPWGFICILGGMGCAALKLALMARHEGSVPPPSPGPPTRLGRRVGVFLQVGGLEAFADVARCAEHVTEATRGWDEGPAVTVDLSVAISSALGDEGVRRVEEWVSKMRLSQMVQEITVLRLPDRGLDVGMFIAQLARAREEGMERGEMARVYDYILKMHTKSDSVWRERAVEALCGNAAQVRSAWHHFESHPSTALVAPLGTSFGPRTGKKIFPHMRRKYWSSTVKPGAAFDPATLQRMHALDRLLSSSPGTYAGEDVAEEDGSKVDRMSGQREKELESSLAIAAGTCWWARGTDRMFSRDLPRHADALLKQFHSGYRENGGVEHALERLIPTRLRAEGKTIAELQPAPKVIAFLFPQYHQVAENDRLWGEGFTEWTLLNSSSIPGVRLRYPLPWKEGGLGWYNLLDIGVRRRQAELAKLHGIHGFAIYHYWGLGGLGRVVMPKVPLAMLEDGQPDLPFFFSWANEPWVRSWSGISNSDHPHGGEVLLSQEYGTQEEWEAHFKWLLPFFSHRNYIRVGGMPCFAIYRIGHMGAVLEPMLALWRNLATKHGFPGLHIITTLGGFRSIDEDTHRLELSASIDAGLHFWPSFWGHEQRNSPERGRDQAPASLMQLSAGRLPTQYWGACVGFEKAPRTGYPTPRAMAYPRPTPAEFRTALGHSFEALGALADREVRQNFYFVTAWNEWNEQACLEPDDISGMGYLQSVRDALCHVPALPVDFRDHK